VPGITEAEYAQQRQQLGRAIHENHGVWWETTAPFYAKPAFDFRLILPRQARPRWHKSFLGYSHQVPTRAQANRTLEWMVLEGENLKQFSLGRLRSEKRNQIRKGLKLCEVRLIPDLEACLEDMRQINISQAQRLMADDTFGLPPTYYVSHQDKWRAELLKRFGLDGHEWWGAFHQGVLVAYLVTYQVESVRFFQVMKTHTEHLKLCATDAVYFRVLEQASRDADCLKIINGGPAREGLNRFKEQFLFKRSELFYFSSGAVLHRAAKRLLRRAEVARAHLQRCFGGIGPTMLKP
jgi:hypothetical protein